MPRGSSSCVLKPPDLWPGCLPQLLSLPSRFSNHSHRLQASKLLTLIFVPGLLIPHSSSTHSLPVIHENEEYDFSSPSHGLGGTTLGAQPYSFSYPGNANTDNILNAFEDPFTTSNQTYPAGASNMNIMSRNTLPSPHNTLNQGLGGSGTGMGGARRPSHQPGRTGMATNQAVTRAALGMAGSPGQASSPGQFSTVDLTGIDYATGSPSSMGLYGGTLNSGIDPNPFMSGGYDTFSSPGGGAQPNPHGQGARDISPVPKFDPEHFASVGLDFVSPPQHGSSGAGERETKPDRSRLRTPTRAPRNQRASAAMRNMSPATPGANSSPGDSSFDASASGGRGSGSRRRATPQQQQQPPAAYQAHVPPNRIAEAGPVAHPDPEFRPYGTNHWHVFLREPTLLKYLSSTEIKDIRDHCYGMAAKGAAAANNPDGDDDDQQQGQPRPVAPGSQYTTADAQAVWKHCDAYIRRRSQVRNNQAARRSRQRKDAETRYWKALAVQYGAPEHEFDWSLVDEDGNLPDYIVAPPPPASSSAARTATAEGGGGGGGNGGSGSAPQTRARARAQQARAQQQQQHGGDGQGQQGGGGQGQQQAANRRASASSGAAAQPEFDFNQPLDFDEDDKTSAGNFDPFTGEF